MIAHEITTHQRLNDVKVISIGHHLDCNNEQNINRIVSYKRP